MSKAQLVKDIANATGTSQQQTNEFLKAFTEAVQQSVASGNDITIVGFGTFYKTRRKATVGRNPRTGVQIQIKATNQPKFRAGKTFKEAVNG